AGRLGMGAETRQYLGDASQERVDRHVGICSHEYHVARTVARRYSCDRRRRRGRRLACSRRTLQELQASQEALEDGVDLVAFQRALSQIQGAEELRIALYLFRGERRLRRDLCLARVEPTVDMGAEP